MAMKTFLEHQLEEREGEDIIQWGRNGDGIFQVKEAYFSMLDLGENQSRPLWGKIWLASLWPKISTFLWLVANKKILTWEHLLHRGFVGSYRCFLCMEAEESLDHLLDSCKFMAQL